MDIAVFYELQDRLYNAALAGCGIIPDDFRFKRAVEGLGALAEKGKVFAALKQKCENLLTAGEDAASQLADCIALADAIAVTLGRANAAGNKVMQADETEPEPGAEDDGIWQRECPVKDIPASVMTQVFEILSKASEKVLEIPDTYPEVLTDIRFCTRLAEGLNGKASQPYDRLAAIMLEICGSDLAKIYKEGVDLRDAAAKGRQVALIAQKYGARENAWYLELAQNENAPQKVRLEAIAALACSAENDAVLLELYQTGKGKIKNAAIESLVRINSEGIQSYLEKLCEKEVLTQAEADLIGISSASVCETYALKKVLELKKQSKPTGRFNFLDHKTGSEAEEACLTLSKFMRNYNGADGGVQEVLIRNLFENYEGTEDLLNRLYAKEPKFFAEAHVYSNFMNGTLQAADLKEVNTCMYGVFREDKKCPVYYRFASELVRHIHAIPVINRYRLEWTRGYDFGTKWLGEHYPQVLLEVLTSQEALRNFHATAECCVTLAKLCLSSRPETRMLCADYGQGIYSVGSWDREQIAKMAVPFLEKAVEAHPSVYYGALIHRVIPDRKGRDDLYYEFVRKNIELHNLDRSVSPGGGWNLSYFVEDSNREQMIKEYDFADKKISSGALKARKEDTQKVLDVIYRMLGADWLYKKR